MSRERNEPLVSVLVMAYNHEEYIAECLESIINQKVNFRYEVILGEDESDDQTRSICKSYAKKYPDLIKLYLRSRDDAIYINNRPTGRFNFIESYKHCKGKYIALCDGDDYWLDSNKLQKQINFLEANQDYALSFHNVIQRNTFDNTEVLIPNLKEDMDLRIEDYILNNKTATCAMVYKKSCFGDEFPDWFWQIPFGDLGIVLQVLKKSNGKARIFADVMGVYRIHGKSSHGKLHQNNASFINAFLQHSKFTNIIQRHLLYENQYKKVFRKKRHMTSRRLAGLYFSNGNPIKGIYHKIRAKYYNYCYIKSR